MAGLARPSKPGMAELGMLKLSCSRCLPGPARRGQEWADFIKDGPFLAARAKMATFFVALPLRVGLKCSNGSFAARCWRCLCEY